MSQQSCWLLPENKVNLSPLFSSLSRKENRNAAAQKIDCCGAVAEQLSLRKAQPPHTGWEIPRKRDDKIYHPCQ